MELRGQIEEIIYQNEVNSYTIAEISSEDQLITIVGYLPFINVGDYLKLQGKIVNHPDYGEQFKVETFEKTMPQDINSLEKYLASGTIKGIGPATARKIIEKFGEETISVFKFEPSRLSQVKGISKDKAISIGQEFNEKWEVWQIVGYLEKFGIGANNSKKVFDSLGKDAIDKIEKNPYVLVDIIYGIDFKKIDKIAMEIGIPIDDDNRIKSGIKYALLLSTYNGNTCVNRLNLIEFVKTILLVETSRIEENIINLKAECQIYEEDRNDEKWIYLFPLYKAEKNIATNLLRLNNFKNIKKIKHFKTELKKQEEKLDIILSEKQIEALEQINNNNVCIITGGPGTGKTTIIKCLIEIYKSYDKKVVLCAPTGRAAKRMTETTGEDAKTIHRLLEIGKIEDDKLENVDIDLKPIDADVVVVDEMSMVDVFIMNYIAKALFLGTKIVLVGDPNQLPSVGPGTILKDLIECGEFSSVVLNKIFRQAAKSKIIVNSHRVNDGISFIGKKDDEDKNEDFFYINELNPEKIKNQIISLSNGRLKNYGNYDFFSNIQILTPTKKGMLGTKELNKYLQLALNPKKDYIEEKQYGDVVFREGDRVMQIKNNYDIYWEKNNNDYKELKFETGSGIFNGELRKNKYNK